MRLSSRLMGVLEALYWNLGSDPDQEIAIDWLLGKGDLQCGHDNEGKAIIIEISQRTIDDLVKLNLIRAENRTGYSSIESAWGSSHSMVRLQPDAVRLIEDAVDNDTSRRRDDRYAGIMLDTYEFSQMLQTYFSVDELKDLCHELGLDYEVVVPANVPKTESIRAIVDGMRRQSRLTELLRAVAQQRPNQDWTQLLRD